MRLVEFLILLLEAHAQSLQRLAALFGEEVLLHLLEESGDEISAKLPPPRFDPKWFEVPAMMGFSSPYAELESAVHGAGLPAMLEFHLWAYPHYRSFIESEIPLDARIPGPQLSAGSDIGIRLVDEAVEQSEAWLKNLPIAPEFALQALQASHVAWLRFRTLALKRVGRRPLGPVY
jgi:hypothetical protein